MTHPLFDLSGRVALVTGAASGMGRAMAIGFVEVGADLLLADIDSAGVGRTAEQITALGRRAVAVTCDITKLDELDALFERLDREYGRIDILGNVYGPGTMSQPEETPIAEIEYVLHGLVAYGMGMAAVVHLTRELSTHWSSRGVRVNAILPAQVMNPGPEERTRQTPGLADVFLRRIPAGRFGRPDDINGLAIFLASDASDWITGAIVPMDGGNLAKNSGG